MNAVLKLAGSAKATGTTVCGCLDRALVTRPMSLHSIRLFFRLHGLAAVSKTGVGAGGAG